MQLDPDSTAVVVVDMQNGFCHPDGSLYAPGSEEAIDPVNGVIEAGRAAGAQMVFTRDVHPPEQFADAHYYDEFERWGEHVLEGSWEAELLDDLDVEPGDHVVEKHTYDAFHETELDGWLSARGIDDLLIRGTLANVRVLHTAGSAGLGLPADPRERRRGLHRGEPPRVRHGARRLAVRGDGGALRGLVRSLTPTVDPVFRFATLVGGEHRAGTVVVLTPCSGSISEPESNTLGITGLLPGR